MATMSTKERLAKRRQQEQDVRNYPPSSRWYIGLNNAINYVDLAETSTAPKDKFLNAWSAIYNLYMMTHVRGQIENVTLSGWIDLIKLVPDVRRQCEQVSDDFLKNLDKAKKTLLIDAERKQWRECKQFLDAWQSKRQRDQALSAEKACTYTFLIGRDLRNAVSHPTLNPSAVATKRALSSAADLFLGLAIAAIESTIEHPPEGTTGKATAYRSFLYPFMVNSDSFFSDYYLERLMPDQELTEFDNAELKESLKQLNRDQQRLDGQLKAEDAGRELTAQEWCEPILFPALGLVVQSGTQIVSEQAVFEPSYAIARPNATMQREYRGKAAGKDLACLIWVVPWRSRSLDAVPEDEKYKEEFSGLTWMEIGQRSLLASDVPWAILTNGRKLRLLGKETAHKPRAFLEMTLEEVISQRGTAEGKLAFHYLLGLFSGVAFTERDSNERTRLDRVLVGSERHGKEISDELKQNVFRALEELGDGFLGYMKANADAVQQYKTVYTLEPKPDEALLTDIYQESLSLMYRLLFLFYAESRDMLPMEDELYRESYSLESMRDEIIATLDNPDPTRYFRKGSVDLWQRLTKQLFPLIQKGGLAERIPAYNGGLFDPGKHPFLEHFTIGDYYLARAIDLLSRTRPNRNKPKGEGRKKVTYRDLDVRHLGSIYEGILEYSAHTAEQEMAIVLKGTGSKKHEEYASITELNGQELEDFNAYKAATEEDSENPDVTSRSKVTGVKESGQYFLVSGGRESKRKSSGSYYTPDYIVQYIVENTLGPLVRGENREGRLKNQFLEPDEILSLKVLDPAMGSGHFLVAATEFLARAYGEAMIRTGQDLDGIMDKDEFTRYKRMVAERCIYGVDVNPMAVELSKLSMWLFTMDRNRPLSFLNHRLKCGNSLIGMWIEDFKEIPLFEPTLRAKIPIMIGKLFSIMQRETETIQDIEAKKTLDQSIETLKKPFQNTSNALLEGSFGSPSKNLFSFVTDIESASNYQSIASNLYNFFHWEIEFPEVFFDSSGNRMDAPGFDAVIGNPPWGSDFDELELLFYKGQNREIVVRMIDSFMYFVYRMSKYLTKGYISMIVPDVLTYQGDNLKLRQFLLEHFILEKILNVGSVFEGVTRPAMIFLAKQPNIDEENESDTSIADVSHKEVEEKLDAIRDVKSNDIVKQSFFKGLPNFIFPTSDIGRYKIWDKVKQSEVVKLSELIDNDGIQRGVSPDLKDAFIVDSEVMRIHSLEESCMRRVLTGGVNIKPYFIEDSDQWLVYTTRYDDFDVIPNVCRYIDGFEDRITCKEVRDGKHPIYSLHRPRDKSIFEKEQKFLGVITGDRIIVALDNRKYYASDGIYLFGSKQDVDPYFLLGVLNSEVMTFLYRLIALEKGRVLAQVKPTVMNELLIKHIHPERKKENASYMKIVNMAFELVTSYQSGGLSTRTKSINLEIEAALNKAVFELYELNESDIRIIKEALN